MALASEGRWAESRGVEEAAGCCTPAQEAIAAASRQDPMRRRLASPPRWGSILRVGSRSGSSARGAWPESRCGNEAFLNVLRNPAIVISSCSSGLRGAWLFPSLKTVGLISRLPSIRLSHPFAGSTSPRPCHAPAAQEERGEKTMDQKLAAELMDAA